MSTYRVNEIFYSLQGEGYHTGTAAVFVRLSGCNLRCSFCDTDFSSYTEMSSSEIVAEVRRLAGSGAFVVLTGGEPSLQIDAELIDALHNDMCYVCVETNGTHTLPPDIDWITCSPKSGSKLVLGRANEVKVVYTGEEDVEHWRECIKAPFYYLQPCDNNKKMNSSATVAYILQHPWWQLSLQTHKLIGIQ